MSSLLRYEYISNRPRAGKSVKGMKFCREFKSSTCLNSEQTFIQDYSSERQQFKELMPLENGK